jgi:hypothetical protein
VLNWTSISAFDVAMQREGDDSTLSPIRAHTGIARQALPPAGHDIAVPNPGAQNQDYLQII